MIYSHLQVITLISLRVWILIQTMTKYIKSDKTYIKKIYKCKSLIKIINKWRNLNKEIQILFLKNDLKRVQIQKWEFMNLTTHPSNQGSTDFILIQMLLLLKNACISINKRIRSAIQKFSKKSNFSSNIQSIKETWTKRALTSITSYIQIKNSHIRVL